jgi:hypothetical protein
MHTQPLPEPCRPQATRGDPQYVVAMRGPKAPPGTGLIFAGMVLVLTGLITLGFAPVPGVMVAVAGAGLFVLGRKVPTLPTGQD